ncbi:MAG: glycoside hydrolase 43 family protein [Bacteroidales bacterium]
MRRLLFRIVITGYLMLLWITAICQPWSPDQTNETFKNPVIYADYSDPDAIRVGDDFFMVSSSFNCVPGLPVLHSNDLIHWKIINHVFDRLVPDEVFSIPQHGNGCWAPSLRYHQGTYYVFFGDPDFGIYMSKTKDPFGTWSPLHLVHEAKGWIDPSPLWDDDGNAYLVHAYAGSRSGRKSILVVHRMRPDGSELLGKGVLVFDGHDEHPTIEGPKFYKRNGYYYIFAPAGGVTTGWQTVLRSQHPFGPYEIKTVMHQGSTEINGPHQGGWVELKNGEGWFLHFQDRDAYGRIVHLNPVSWKDDWPLIGLDLNGDGMGEPVSSHTKPRITNTPLYSVPQTTDEFNDKELGLQWQWHANPLQEWMFLTGSGGVMRLYCQLLPESHRNHWDTPHLLLQKFPTPDFSVTTKLNFYGHQEGERTGLIVMGTDYSYIAIEKDTSGTWISKMVCMNSPDGNEEQLEERKRAVANQVYFRVEVNKGAICRFLYSYDGKEFRPLGEKFRATPGRWIGAKVGLFASSTLKTNDTGYADYDWFRIE